jgi:hypothetical protein
MYCQRVVWKTAFALVMGSALATTALLSKVWVFDPR